MVHIKRLGISHGFWLHYDGEENHGLVSCFRGKYVSNIILGISPNFLLHSVEEHNMGL